MHRNVYSPSHFRWWEHRLELIAWHCNIMACTCATRHYVLVRRHTISREMHTLNVNRKVKKANKQKFGMENRQHQASMCMMSAIMSMMTTTKMTTAMMMIIWTSYVAFFFSYKTIVSVCWPQIQMLKHSHACTNAGTYDRTSFSQTDNPILEHWRNIFDTFVYYFFVVFYHFKCMWLCLCSVAYQTLLLSYNISEHKPRLQDQ